MDKCPNPTFIAYDFHDNKSGLWQTGDMPDMTAVTDTSLPGMADDGYRQIDVIDDQWTGGSHA